MFSHGTSKFYISYSYYIKLLKFFNPSFLQQSETIQRVEFHAQQATLFVDKGADELEKADKLHKKALKVFCLMIFLINFSFSN